MKAFRNLAVVTAVAVYLQVVLGSVVRITGSGLGCRDWPLCYQHETDRFAYRTLLEVAHRLFGTAAGLLVLATAVYALMLYRRRGRGGVELPRGLWIAALVALGIYGFQAVLGGVTVLMKNSPFTVAIHLANAELALGAGILVALWAGRVRAPVGAAGGSGSAFIVAGLVGAYVIVVTGAVVVGTGASGACNSWPLCGRQHSPLADVHMLHRVVVGLGSIAILLAVHAGLRRWRGRGLALAAYLVAGLLVAEVIVGAAQVLNGLPPALRSIHVALASAVWAGMVLLAGGAWLERERVAQQVSGAARLAGVNP
ncbi:MAG: COX15/CtaA family protein [Candidatus Dormibacteria bacterium]